MSNTKLIATILDQEFNVEVNPESAKYVEAGHNVEVSTGLIFDPKDADRLNEVMQRWELGKDGITLRGAESKEHSDYCGQPHAPYVTSSCESGCDYLKESIAECTVIGEHMKRITSVNGYDVCFNCGAKA